MKCASKGCNNKPTKGFIYCNKCFEEAWNYRSRLVKEACKRTGIKYPKEGR